MRLILDNISKQIGSNVILKDLYLEVPSSQMIAIVGENGVGKTTLLKIAVGDWKSDSGKVIRDGRIGYCPQEPRLFPPLTVRENFTYFGMAYQLSETEIQTRFRKLTNYFNFSNYGNHKVEELSGGTRQKLNLSIALMHSPDLLILDEPYSGFDIETYSLFQNHVHELKNSGCSVLMVTHMITDKDAYDKIYSIRNGAIE